MRGLSVALRGAAKKWQVQKLAVGCAAVALCGGLLTQAAVADGTPAPVKAAPLPYDTTAWAGLNWGLGIAADFDIGGTRVANASIVNGLVRLNDTSSNVGVSFVLEAHYFLKDTLLRGCSSAQPTRTPSGYIDYNCTEVAWGPFVAIEVGDGSNSSPASGGPITAYALGLMVGLHHPKVDPTTNKPDTSSWNLGIGLRIDPKAQVLGDGFVANMPPPAGETVIRYKTEPKAGVMLVSSFSF
jgi:hypothetical protein